MTPRRVLIVGSANADLTFRVGRLPLPGETTLADSRVVGPGGKGLNQAVSAARSGAPTSMLGAIGDDDAGALLRHTLGEAGVDVAGLRTVPVATGSAVVLVESSGENAIVVDAGANRQLLDLTADELALIARADVVLTQLEIPLPTVEAALRAAKAAGSLTILNAAPAARLSDDVQQSVDVLVVNEHEARSMSGLDATGDAAQALARTFPTVIVTLGAAGALVATRDKTTTIQGCAAREVVDTTAAGDVFCGAFAAGLAGGLDPLVAVRRACVAGSLAVERGGAAISAPSLAEILARERDLVMGM